MSPSDSRADQFLLSTFILLAISWIVYLCRLYTRLWLVRSMFLEDLFITVAMVRVLNLSSSRISTVSDEVSFR